MTQLVNAELLVAQLKLNEAATLVAALPHTPNLGLIQQSLRAAGFWMDREINPVDPAPKEVA